MFGKNQRNSGEINTLIGDGTQIKGDLRFEGGCHIDGVVQGNITADQDPGAFLTISEDALVNGNVRVPRVSLHGKVQGDVYATETVTLGPTAIVVGNLHYELIEMMSGAEINGKLIHESSQAKAAPKPAKPAAPSAVPAPEQPRQIPGGAAPVKQT